MQALKNHSDIFEAGKDGMARRHDYMEPKENSKNASEYSLEKIINGVCASELFTEEEISKEILNSASIVSHLERSQKVKKKREQLKDFESLNEVIDITPLEMDSEMIKCDICNIKLSSFEKYHTHKLTHFTLHTTECPVCKKMFSSVTNMRYHLATHTEEKKYQCKFCQRKFNWRSQLITHEHIHTGKGLYYCPLCGKPCMTKWLLTRHIQVHARGDVTNAERNNKQKNSNKNDVSDEFSKDHNSTLDSSTDSSDNFKCVDCCEEFSSKELMAAHLLTHLTGQKHKCKTCGRVFRKLAMLRRHLDSNVLCSKDSYDVNLSGRACDSGMDNVLDLSTDQKVPKLDAMLVPNVILPKNFKRSFPAKNDFTQWSIAESNKIEFADLSIVVPDKEDNIFEIKSSISNIFGSQFVSHHHNEDMLYSWNESNNDSVQLISNDPTNKSSHKSDDYQSQLKDIVLDRNRNSKKVKCDDNDSETLSYLHSNTEITSVGDERNVEEKKRDTPLSSLSDKCKQTLESYLNSSPGMENEGKDIFNNSRIFESLLFSKFHNSLVQVHSHYQQMMTTVHAQIAQLSHQVESFQHESLDMIKSLTFRVSTLEKSLLK